MVLVPHLGQRGGAAMPKQDMLTEIGFTPHARFSLTSLSFHCETIHAKTKISSDDAESLA
jgi:hypothetical protein